MMHTISILVDNDPGILARITGLFSAREFNVESLCVARTLDPTISRIVLVTSGHDWLLDQVVLRLRAMTNVMDIQVLTEIAHIDREMVLVRVKATEETKAEILRMVDIF